MKGSKQWRYGILSVLAATAAVTQFVAGGDENKPAKPRLVTMTGRIVDAYSFMTGQAPTGDPAKREHVKYVRECIKSGVPACLDTEDGLMILGKGAKAPLELLLPLAYQQAEVRGKLFEKNGAHYLDIVSVKALKTDEEHGDEEGEEEGGEEEP